jgi:hypothetical protein
VCGEVAVGAARRHPLRGFALQSPTLAGYVREAVTIRYDPRDLSEIRMFHRDRFLCRAVSEEHAGEAVTLTRMGSSGALSSGKKHELTSNDG